MPLLKDLNCWIELTNSQKKLQEFGTFYGDGFVETFVAIPSSQQQFSVRLTSGNFIAPGLAMYVFIDGVYQCNRNRQDLRLREPLDRCSLVDFRVRQKEEKQKDGSLIARDWTFEKLDTASANDAPDLCSANIIDNIGCIEVIVLRCAGSRSAKSALTNNQKASTLNMDGASDMPDHEFGLDGQPRDWDSSLGRPSYDDREPYISSYRSALRPSRSQYGPPPPLPQRASYAKTIYNHSGTQFGSRTDRDLSPPFSARLFRRPHSKDNEHVESNRVDCNRIPSSSYRYGSGPVSHQTKAESQRELFQNRESAAIPSEPPIVNQQWLDQLLTTAVKRGLEQSKQNSVPIEEPIATKEDPLNHNKPTHPPGAWPMSPYGPMMKPHIDWGQHAAHPWRQLPKPHTFVKDPKADEWAPQYTGPESWDTDDMWDMKLDRNRTTRSRDRHSPPKAPGWGKVNPPRSALAASQSTTSKRWTSKDAQNLKSHPAGTVQDVRHKVSTTPDGWTMIDALSGSAGTWSTSSSTVHPSQSRSQVGHPRPNRDNQAYYPQPFEQSTKSSPWEFVVAAPPVGSSSNPPKSILKAPTLTTAPPPTWGCGISQKSRKYSKAATHEPPPPYASTVKGFQPDTEELWNISGSSSSSSWGPAKKASTSNWNPQESKEVVSSDNSWGASNKDDVVTGSLRNKDSSVKQSRFGSKVRTSNGWGIVGPDVQGNNTWKSDAKDQKKNLRGGWGADNTSMWQQGQENVWGGGADAWENKEESKDKNSQDDAWNTNNNYWNNNDAPEDEKERSGNSWDSGVIAQETASTKYERTKADGAAVNKGFNSSNWNDNSGWNTQNESGDTGFNAAGWNQPANTENQDNNGGWGTVNNNAGGWTTGKHNTNSKNQDNGWTAAPAKSVKSAAVSRPGSLASHKSRLSKYRQLSKPVDNSPKSHWAFPTPSPLSTKKIYPIPEDYESAVSGRTKKVYTVPEEPLYKISKEKADEKEKEGVNHQVRAGKGMKYGHAIGRPEYLDSLDKPYAVFRFKYRTRSILKAVFGDDVPNIDPLTTSPARAQAPVSKIDSSIEKEKLKQMPQDQLIDNLLQLQAQLSQTQKASDSKSLKSHRTEIVAQKMTENWVKQHSRGPSEHTISKPPSVKPLPAEATNAAGRDDGFKAVSVKGSNKGVDVGNTQWSQEEFRAASANGWGDNNCKAGSFKAASNNGWGGTQGGFAPNNGGWGGAGEGFTPDNDGWK